ncbi:transcription factor bHLH139-like [Zingiber officinale]|uniref:BHLH domain-containing protein n=1 Tax=Zingiber officinale TaxID=94328 RepID=A0A8J5KGZ5_ZINOF|nr:transcription factor bHLH139-like [Zingiber officinale]KAG6476027.1 hypothetical protein ZIOFF_065262 [Zingiber officinale]
MEGSLEEGYEIMAHFMEQGFDDPSFKVPVWSSATADSSSSYCYYYPSEVENFDSYGGFCTPHFGHGDGFYLNESDVIPQNSEPAICVTAIGDLARFSEDASRDDIGQPVPPPQDPAVCVTAIGDLAHFSEDASSDDIGQPVPPQDPILQIKRKRRDSKDDVSSKTSRKAEVSWNAEKSAPLKKGQKRTWTCDKEDNNVNKTCSYSSEVVDGRQVAEQAPSTNPQSLYAKKRRERINTRLKILQNLVPNGTKVDISTMLEEAVHYVKFLQLQIKLLSSDELWMYAPIAYNGVNIGLDLKTIPQLEEK